MHADDISPAHLIQTKAHDPAVLDAILGRIREQERITFAELMEIALYLPSRGYYASGRARGRDYRTSPTTHPVFATLLALQLEQMWVTLGRLSRFDVIEVGAAGGELAGEVTRTAPRLCADFAKALRYVAVDAFAPIAQRGAFALVRASALALPFTGLRGCIVSNELIDAFPVHRVLRSGRRLQEQFVSWSDDGFVEVRGELSDPALATYFDRLELEPREGALVEVNLEGERFIAAAAGALEAGFVVTIDYGKPAEDLFLAGEASGSVRCFRQHRCVSNPYQFLGHQDITADVDFSNLVVAGREAGLSLAGSTTQREFLVNLGFEAFEQQLERSTPDAGARYRNKFAMQELVSRSGLGAFRVLVQHKGLHDPELDGLHAFGKIRRDLLFGRRHVALPTI